MDGRDLRKANAPLVANLVNSGGVVRQREPAGANGRSRGRGPHSSLLQHGKVKLKLKLPEKP